jgi:ATP-dependent DNA helicase RecG
LNNVTATPSQRQSLLQRDLTSLKGVGAKVAEKLQAMGLHAVQDLLFHLPYRYQDRTRIAQLGGLVPGQSVAVDVRVRAADVVFGKRRALLVRATDGTGLISLRFFHFNQTQKNQLAMGQRLLCFGEIRPGPTGLEMVHPEYRVLQPDTPYTPEQTLTPWYPTAEGVQQLRIRDLVGQVLPLLAHLEDWIPERYLQHAGLPDLKTALYTLHKPAPDADTEQLLSGTHPAQQRLALEELLAHHLRLRQTRSAQTQWRAPPMQADSVLTAQALGQLPFSLTGAQSRVLSEIRQDMAQSYPLSRLVQGDVGSGKTVVAMLAGLQAVASGHQFALMAPTEILAEQHAATLRAWLTPLGIQLVCLTGKLTKKVRDSQLAQIASGQAQVIVGTHALFQPQVVFASLAFIVIDEQHRFGVDQRLALRAKSEAKGWVPHQLVMTATPIPRTLAQSLYADMDYSVIDELPPGRQDIITRVMSHQRRQDLIDRVSDACGQGRQVYWVCTLIEESEELQCQDAEETAQSLRVSLPNARIGLIHGRMKPNEKSEVMAAFKAHALDVLVATTVIEVGVDVPNATVMIIENPERLGLSQLHQLRGRVGRGAQQSFCLMLYGEKVSAIAKQRLSVLRETQDGFVIAEQDLQLRGPGELLGTRQTGLQQFRMADLQRDMGLLPEVQRLAALLLAEHPERVPLLIARWLSQGEKYASV